MENITIFDYRSPRIVYGIPLGKVFLDTELMIIKLTDETVENIKEVSVNKKSILEKEFYAKPRMDASGISLTDIETAEKFFSSLDKIPDNENGKRIKEFFSRGCKTSCKDKKIQLNSDMLELFDIREEDYGKEVELLVGYVKRNHSEGDGDFREYFIINPTDSFKDSQERYRYIMGNDSDIMNDILK